MANAQPLVSEKDYSRYGFREPDESVYRTKKGLSREIVEEISKIKNEPKWMLDFRLKALEFFQKRPLPTWGPDLSSLNFDEIVYYIKPTEKQAKSWEDLPEGIRRTFEKLGIPEAERKFLAGVGSQYDSEVVYHKLKEDLEKQGVIFTDMDTGMREYPEIVKKYFGTIIPPNDNKFAALNSCVWSGGSFVYIPEGVEVKTPLQAYFRINSENMGQFERTLIIAEPNSKCHYIEGCTAATYQADALHAAVVEIVALPGSHVRYTTLQNWSTNVYNLVTKRARAYENAFVEWLDANIGSKATMKYPSIYLVGRGSRAEILSIAFAGKGQNLDAGAKAIHMAPDTSSKIVNKSVSKDGGRTNFRGFVKIFPGAINSKSHTRCDALILDEKSNSGTIPQLDIDENRVNVGHEATVGKVGEDQLFYLMSRGLSEDEAVAMIVNGFFETFVKELPLEYAVEFNRLIQLEMTGAVG
ncbi:MAG: Fe-S cluster assembly protein SufB [Candidatus Aenigmarchaeota archaeon]|nr:Fe-S cluster assembly protein SufB [Candidatus Aenigmarchaeota archaeon]